MPLTGGYGLPGNSLSSVPPPTAARLSSRLDTAAMTSAGGGGPVRPMTSKQGAGYSSAGTALGTSAGGVSANRRLQTSAGLGVGANFDPLQQQGTIRTSISMAISMY